MTLLYSNEKASELESLASPDGGKLPESRVSGLRSMNYDEQRAALAPVQLKPSGAPATSHDASDEQEQPEKAQRRPPETA